MPHVSTECWTYRCKSQGIGTGTPSSANQAAQKSTNPKACPLRHADPTTTVTYFLLIEPEVVLLHVGSPVGYRLETASVVICVLARPQTTTTGLPMLLAAGRCRAGSYAPFQSTQNAVSLTANTKGGLSRTLWKPVGIQVSGLLGPGGRILSVKKTPSGIKASPTDDSQSSRCCCTVGSGTSM